MHCLSATMDQILSCPVCTESFDASQRNNVLSRTNGWQNSVCVAVDSQMWTYYMSHLYALSIIVITQGCCSGAIISTNDGVLVCPICRFKGNGNLNNMIINYLAMSAIDQLRIKGPINPRMHHNVDGVNVHPSTSWMNPINVLRAWSHQPYQCPCDEIVDIVVAWLKSIQASIQTKKKEFHIHIEWKSGWTAYGKPWPSTFVPWDGIRLTNVYMVSLRLFFFCFFVFTKQHLLVWVV